MGRTVDKLFIPLKMKALDIRSGRRVSFGRGGAGNIRPYSDAKVPGDDPSHWGRRRSSIWTSSSSATAETGNENQKHRDNADDKHIGSVAEVETSLPSGVYEEPFLVRQCRERLERGRRSTSTLKSDDSMSFIYFPRHHPMERNGQP
ncbi:hypothetical protein CMUS01_01288 [Colletotrichum musicola]|uniref:Uncharacterized protein n=1 Tax=Colletotrichum musicola TaxID=2175873 RepID=A0A8H6NXE9_9PEZI|nr:hypothetical protein CMUS01_01288 [Colletotrichum musicola]